MKNTARKTGQTLLASLLLLASVCLCAATFPPAPQAENPHGNHAHNAMTMALADDMPAPCDEADKPCHVVAEADNTKPASAILAPRLVVVSSAYLSVRVLDLHVPSKRVSHWARPPPDPVSRRDRSLT